MPDIIDEPEDLYPIHAEPSRERVVKATGLTYRSYSLRKPDESISYELTEVIDTATGQRLRIEWPNPWGDTQKNAQYCIQLIEDCGWEIV